LATHISGGFSGEIEIRMVRKAQRRGLIGLGLVANDEFVFFREGINHRDAHIAGMALLPALPPKWKDGSVQGLRARGDFTVDLTWVGGQLASATIHAGKQSSGEIRVVYQNKSKTLQIAPGKSATLTPKDWDAENSKVEIRQSL
jgi:hypothetical protein